MTCKGYAICADSSGRLQLARWAARGAERLVPAKATGSTRPKAVLRTPGIPARKRGSDLLQMRRTCQDRLCGGSSQGCETAARQFLG